MTTSPQKAPDDRLMTVREVASRDNCSERTVRRAIAAGLLEAIRIGPGGRHLRITRAAHRRYRDRWGSEGVSPHVVPFQ